VKHVRSAVAKPQDWLRDCAAGQGGVARIQCPRWNDVSWLRPFVVYSSPNAVLTRVVAQQHVA